MPGAAYKQGNIVLVPFPFTNLQTDKVRPAIIISNSKVNGTSDVICAQITSQVYNDDYSFEFYDKDITHPLGGRHEVRCHKIFTVEKAIIQKKISHLHADRYPRLAAKITSLLKQEA